LGDAADRLSRRLSSRGASSPVIYRARLFIPEWADHIKGNSAANRACHNRTSQHEQTGAAMIKTFEARLRADAMTRVGTPPLGLLLRLEGLIAGGIGIGAFAYLGVSWWLFAALILAPDLSGIGYLFGRRTGAWAYDLALTYAAPALPALIGVALNQPELMAVAAIWASHIGFDRMIGYGLKFEGDPKDTHIARAAR
jgi:Domain of unknown function (DUF4260)